MSSPLTSKQEHPSFETFPSSYLEFRTTGEVHEDQLVLYIIVRTI
jgi:hypothetical protein